MRHSPLGKAIWSAVLWGVCVAAAGAEVVQEADLQAARQWAQQHLLDTAQRQSRGTALEVWACHGVREVADRVHENGAKFVLWVEPERVTEGSWLAQHHPQWILRGDGGLQLLNLGVPEAWQWLVEKIDGLIKSEGVDVYGQDFNMQPLSCWRRADEPDRQGLTEMRHVAGYLAFWDELLRRHPQLYIDTCASGGRRNDLETLRRSVPLLRSDCFAPAETQQAHTMGLALWIPYFGSGMGPEDTYWCRSCIFPASRLGLDTRDGKQDYTQLNRMIAECRSVQKYLLGDYYPLTSHSLASDVWAAWQFDRPEIGAGIVQVFRRSNSPCETARFKPRSRRGSNIQSARLRPIGVD